MADRVERLTNLLALLLETTEPLSLVQIAAELEGQYPDADQARRAAFERDKAALREIGVPIDTEVVTGGAYAGQTRYRIDRHHYELADLALEPDEVRALQVAAATVHTDSSASKQAIWKLGGVVGGDEHLPVSAVLPDLPELPVIRSAVAARAAITFGYRDRERTLDPWGLLLRGGFWYVVGYDHDHEEQRTYRVDRFDGGADSIRTGESGAFARPAAFDARAAFPADPKELLDDDADAVEATVRIDAGRAAAVCRELGDERVVATGDDGSVVVRVPASNRAAFRSWVLGLLEHAVVLDPPEVRADVVDWLTAVGGSS